VVKGDFAINVEARFPNLPRAPIAEAVLQWQAAPAVAVTPEDFRAVLTDSFAEYEVSPLHRFEAALAGSPDGMQVHQRSLADGTRLQKLSDGKPQFVAQMKADGVIFSRLAPYADWDEFASEANRFWEMYTATFQPTTIARLSVRYISEIPVNSLDEARKYLKVVNEPLEGLGVSTDLFFHQDTLKPGNHPFSIRVTRAVQIRTPNSGDRSLIVDIEAMTADAIEIDQLAGKLAELRFLKNSVFFALMKDPETHFGEAL
jgi:uncharacterized protein (TIGR04255 family)